MIELQKLRDFTWPSADENSGFAMLSAASGLVIAGQFIYVIADDEFFLGQFVLDDWQSGNKLPLFAGELPVDKAARKAMKPDLEAITMLPCCGRFPSGALLAVGSGSTQQRKNGIVIALGSNGEIAGLPQVFSMQAIFIELQKLFHEINIEGAFVAGEHLVLMQRANNKYRNNALVYCPLALFLDLIEHPGQDFSAALQVVEYTLPEVAGVALGFTDGALLPGGDIVFTAVAENTEDSYNDGACVGAAIGIINSVGKLVCCELLAQPYKIEGVAVLHYNDKNSLLLVTDADNAAIPAALFAVTNFAWVK